MTTTTSPSHKKVKKGPARPDWRALEGGEKSNEHSARQALHSTTVMNFMIVAMIAAFAALTLYWMAIEPTGGTWDSIMGSLIGLY